MKEYTYKGFTFRATSTQHANTMRPLYEIDGLKCRGTRPFLTSIADCKQYIRRAIITPATTSSDVAAFLRWREEE